MRARNSIEYVEVDKQGIGWNVRIVFASHRNIHSRYDRTTKTQIPPVITNFECPLCGHTTFEVTYKDRESLFTKPSGHDRIGPRTGPTTEFKDVDEFFCPKCTTVFKDPAKFSKNQPPHFCQPVATERPGRFELDEEDEKIRLGLQEAFQRMGDDNKL